MLFLHSDRGVQYQSIIYQEVQHDYGFNGSMSRKGNCWDRAVEEARAGIFEYIKLFYNQTQRYSTNGYISPNQYERKYTQLNVSTFRKEDKL